jgi:Kef-type K+ transport system membrane component KefB
MTEIWALAALWLGLALIATLVSIWLRIATALSEIVVGTIAQLFIGAALGSSLLAGDATWIKFVSGAGAILLTFLAGAELDPVVFRKQWKEACAIGLVSFAAPFLGCAAAARWLLGWQPEASWLADRALCGGAFHRSHRGRPSWPYVVRALADSLRGPPGHCLRALRDYGSTEVMVRLRCSCTFARH